MGRNLEHDPNLCQCSFGEAEDFFVECSCPCPRCQEFRNRTVKLKKLLELEERLKRAGIDIVDLADMILIRMDKTLEQRIERIVKVNLSNWLRGVVSFKCTVDATSAEEFF